jgi:hypothetical protein
MRARQDFAPTFYHIFDIINIAVYSAMMLENRYSTLIKREVFIMLQEKDFVWKEHYENNMNTNPLQEWCCIIDVGDTARKYSIVPQYPSKDGICVDHSCDPEYYILMEAIGRKATDEDKNSFVYQYSNYDGYMFNTPSLVRVFTDMESAKKRAYVQYKAIFGFVLSHITDIDNATKNHFVI